jgi:hypothetical protein
VQWTEPELGSQQALELGSQQVLGQVQLQELEQE